MIAVVATCLIYPWVATQPLASKLVHLPLALIPLWIAYEMAMPDYMNIRVDLFFIAPLILLALVIWAIKIGLFRRREQDKPNKEGCIAACQQIHPWLNKPGRVAEELCEVSIWRLC